MGQSLSIADTVCAQLVQNLERPHGTRATPERATMRHTSHVSFMARSLLTDKIAVVGQSYSMGPCYRNERAHLQLRVIGLHNFVTVHLLKLLSVVALA